MASTEEHTDGRRKRGAQTRATILAAATDIASVEGLEGLTIGRLATELGMSKSGLFAHFGSKEELQLATIAEAERIFSAHVIEPAFALPPGRARLEKLIEGWIDYLQGGVFAGGCFFNAVRAEFDSKPAGPVRDAIVADTRAWLRKVVRTIEGAQEAGDLRADVDAELLAFEIEALGSAANTRHQLGGSKKAFALAEQAIRERLDAAAPSRARA